jgi:hypothetical protein
MRLTHMLFVAVAFVAAGCSATGPVFRSAPTPSSTQSLLHVYRPNAWALSGRTARIEVNGVHLVDLNNKGYVSVYLTPGRHRITQSWTYWPGDDKAMQETIGIVLDAKPGEEHVVEMASRTESTHNQILFEWILREVPMQSAQSALAICRQDEVEKDFLSNVPL